MSVCVNGHPRTEANTYIRPNGTRCCRMCINASARARSGAERPRTRPEPTTAATFALSRLRAERVLVRAHRDEAAELEVERGHIRAIVELVRRYRGEYSAAYREAIRALGGIVTGAAAHGPEVTFSLKRRATA